MIFRGDGVVTTRWKSNPDSFLFGFVGFGHGHIDGWDIKIARNGLRCHWGINGYSVKGGAASVGGAMECWSGVERK